MQTTVSKEDLRVLMGKNLRKLRESYDLSLNGLAERMNLTPGFVGLIERGKRGLSAHMMYTTARIFNVSVNYFFTGAVPESAKDGGYAKITDKTDGVAALTPVIILLRKCLNDLESILLKC